jgi:hypothetical protein
MMRCNALAMGCASDSLDGESGACACVGSENQQDKKEQKMENIKKLAGAAIVLGAVGFATQASATVPDPEDPSGDLGKLIINEYNAVGPDKKLDDCPGQPDPVFGCDNNNGGDWLELVVTQNISSIVGWKIYWENGDSGGHPNNGSLTFANHAAWTNLKAGTFITLRWNDTTYGGPHPSTNTCAGAGSDWWIRVNAADTNYITSATFAGATSKGPGLKTDNDCWHAWISDGTDYVQWWVGEDDDECTNLPGSLIWAGSGISSREVGKLEANPVGTGGNGNTNYNDGDCSSFGGPNCWNNGTGGTQFQNLNALCASGCGSTTSTCY